MNKCVQLQSQSENGNFMYDALFIKHGQNSHEVSQMRNYANTYKYLNSHRTCESHLMRISTQNSHRRKALIIFRILVETLQNVMIICKTIYKFFQIINTSTPKTIQINTKLCTFILIFKHNYINKINISFPILLLLLLHVKF